MSEQVVKRYDPFGYDGLSALMHEDAHGDWVRSDDYDALHAEAEAMRVVLHEIASVNPAQRGIEWAKSYASDGLKGAGSELYARWLDTFKEAEALRSENGRLKRTVEEGMPRLMQQGYELRTQLEETRGLLEQRIPCDVMLPPATTIKRGCPLSTVLAGMKMRENIPANQQVFSTTPQPAPDVRHGDGDITLTPDAAKILAECIGAHAYMLQALVNGRSDLALMEAKKWVDGFKEAAEYDRQAQQGD